MTHFNPRSREGSDCVFGFLTAIFTISIHAPARGATQFLRPRSPEAQISIHAPARGATKRATGSCENLMNFNPRSREGSDDVVCHIIRSIDYFNPRSREGSDWETFGNGQDGDISIHAPARGATCRHIHYDFSYFKFQSTLPRGERQSAAKLKKLQSDFNPRSREGSDAAGVTVDTELCNFNPRSREGSDESP